MRLANQAAGELSDANARGYVSEAVVCLLITAHVWMQKALNAMPFEAAYMRNAQRAEPLCCTGWSTAEAPARSVINASPLPTGRTPPEIDARAI